MSEISNWFKSLKVLRLDGLMVLYFFSLFSCCCASVAKHCCEATIKFSGKASVAQYYAKR